MQLHCHENGFVVGWLVLAALSASVRLIPMGLITGRPKKLNEAASFRALRLLEKRQDVSRCELAEGI